MDGAGRSGGKGGGGIGGGGRGKVGFVRFGDGGGRGKGGVDGGGDDGNRGRAVSTDGAEGEKERRYIAKTTNCSEGGERSSALLSTRRVGKKERSAPTTTTVQINNEEPRGRSNGPQDEVQIRPPSVHRDEVEGSTKVLCIYPREGESANATTAHQPRHRNCG